ncbi:radical SAM protein [Lewinella sp. LCG006]|uniref:B12-binding domain-containing radical SAM protein n=1 Tax=Lewinella sp. LCG006 TaxID=3231911 RepID=UPI00345FE206
MKICFTHAYYMLEDEKEKKINKPYPPLGLLYLSAWLEQHGYDNEVYDTTFSSFREQQAYLLEQQPGIIAIYTNLMTKLGVIALIKFIRSQSSLANSLVVLGGPDLRYNIDNYLATGADVLVIGEGEQSMLALVEAVEQGLRPHFGHIPGLAFIDEDGKVTQTPARQHLRAVDELPMPNRKKIDLKRYLDLWKEHHDRSSITVSTQRGCPYTCRWCSTAVYGQSYRRRSAAQVAAELKLLKEEYQPDQVWFVDDVFTVSHKWLESFRDEVLKQDAVIPYECITRAERLNEEVLTMLKESGCFRIWIGAESGSQRIIDAMDRRVSAEQVQQMTIATKQAGMETGTFIMLGYPGETEEDIYLTLDHLKKANPDHFTITVAYPIKGTGLYEDVKNQITKQPDWFSSTDRDIDFLRTYPREYYDYAVRWVVNSVQLHKLRLAQQQNTPRGWKLQLKVMVARLGMLWYRIDVKKGMYSNPNKSRGDAKTAELF